jgi:N-carbamoylputrescine amidase
MSIVTIAATQMACTWDRDANVARAERLIREAAGRGANIVLIQELFETPYFCKDHSSGHFELARPLEGHPAVEHFRKLARELDVVLPVSVFERANNVFFNSVVVVDADGSVLGSYRKSHIPEGPGYHEKFYFSPGDTGFKVFVTKFAKIGVAICWDQWFPETARCLALMGAEILLYPTAIGSEPQDSSLDSSAHWQRTMQGHAAANIMPLVASNRIGTEKGEKYTMTFYGSSFIASPTGEIVAEADRDSEAVLTARFDLDAVRRYRQAWGVFRDRRPDLYHPLLSLDGRG